MRQGEGLEGGRGGAGSEHGERAEQVRACFAAHRASPGKRSTFCFERNAAFGLRATLTHTHNRTAACRLPPAACHLPPSTRHRHGQRRLQRDEREPVGREQEAQEELDRLEEIRIKESKRGCLHKLNQKYKKKLKLDQLAHVAMHAPMPKTKVAAIVIQKHARRIMAKEVVERLRKQKAEKSAKVLQKEFRLFQFRKSRQNATRKLEVVWRNVKRRRAFSDAWIAFLRLPNFPEDVYRKILARLHLDVIPHHVNPVLLCDFCVSSVNVGGLIGMLALHALFVLVTRHNLEYPKFYDRLYNLINEDSFYANGRRTFFELADVFLKSPALPGYCAAAFCKKFGRLSLSAPPAGAMLCVSFIHNLMRRHPKSCLPLIHRDRDVVGGGGGVNIDNAEEDNTAAERDENVMKRKSSNNTIHRRSFDEDPYDFSTKDPAKSRALESSLWEMTALENHYFPQVTKLVQMLRMDLGDRVKTKEIDISGGGAEAQHSLCSANYYSLLKEELDVRLKSVALKHGTIGDLGLFHSDEFVSAAGFGELIQWKEEEEEDFGR